MTLAEATAHRVKPTPVGAQVRAADRALPTPMRWIARPPLFAGGLTLVAVGTALLEGWSVTGGAAVWLVGLGLLLVACWGPASSTAVREPPISRSELAAVACLLGVSLLARVWAPDDFPNGIHVDEAAIGLVAIEALEGRGPHPFAFAFIREPAPFVYAEAIALRLSGGGLGGARVMAGVAGATTVLVVWLLARLLFGPRVALVAAGLLSLSAAHLHFSRLALNIVEIPLFGLLAVAFAWLGVQQGRPFWHAMAGLSLGVGQFGAFGSRSFILVLAGTYAALLLSNLRSWRAVLRGGLLGALVAGAVVVPQVVHIREDPSLLWDRLEARSLFRRWDQAIELHGTDQPLGVMLGQISTNLLAYVSLPDRGPFYLFAHEPLLFPPLGVLFMVGLVIAIVQLRDPRFATPAMACLVVLAGGVFSAGAPQFHRLVLAVPVACIVAAVAADRLAVRVDRTVRLVAPQGARFLAPLLLSAAVLGTAVDGISTVFVRHPELYPWQPQTAWARWAASQDSDRTVLLAGTPNVYAWDERMRLLARGVRIRDVLNPGVDLPAALAEGQPFLFALNPRLDDWLPLVRFLLPDTPGEQVTGQRGEPLLLKFEVANPRPPAPTSNGLPGEVVVSGDAARIGEPRYDAALAFREASKLSNGRPFRASWSGNLLVKDPGEYRLELYTDGGAELLLDGKSVIEGRPSPEPRSLRVDLQLGQGPHPIEVSYSYIRGPGTFELRWRPPGGDRTLVPPDAMRPG